MNQNIDLMPANRNVASSDLCLAAGMFLTVLALYVLFNPGRIDLIDGQVRYEVTMNWVTMGRPVLRDPFLLDLSAGAVGKNGFTYSHYGPAASVAAMPLVWAGTFYDDPPGEATRFLFSLTGSVFGALAAGMLYLFYIELGVGRRSALIWVAISASATLMWPASGTTFDNVQHACLMLIAVFMGYLSSKRNSLYLAALGGLVGGLLFTYQEYFGLILPLLALSTIDWRAWSRDRSNAGARVILRPILLFLKLNFKAALREFESPTGLSPEEVQAFHQACWRYVLFMLTTLVGVGLAIDYNYVRFGSLFEYGKIPHQGPPVLGNPITGLLTLLVSPGKSILLYSPTIILGFAGLRRLWRHAPQIGLILLATSVVLVLFISLFAFAGGDWCWGPRYLTPLVPLWSLAFPFVPIELEHRRNLAAIIVGLGLLVQCLAVSAENQRFFFERGFNDFFWAEDPWCYFKHSALAARPAEVWSITKGPPREAVGFNTYRNPPTYTTLGTPKGFPRSRAPIWMRHYRVFYVPKPWPLWIWDIPAERRAINPTAWLAGTFGLALLGCALLYRGLQNEC